MRKMVGIQNLKKVIPFSDLLTALIVLRRSVGVNGFFL